MIKKPFIDGLLLGGGRDIPPGEEDDPRCRLAPDDWKPTTSRLWTPNRVSTAISTLGVRTSLVDGESVPGTPVGMAFLTEPELGDEAWQNPVSGGDPMYEPGFAEVVTAHPTRMRANLGRANEEVCHYATGALALDEDGFAVAVIGNDPEEDEDKTNYVGQPFVATPEMVQAELHSGMQVGFTYFGGGYLNLLVAEFHYHSPFPWCRGIS